MLIRTKNFSSFGFHFESRCVWYRTTVFNRYYKSLISWSQMSIYTPVVSVCKYTLGTCSQFTLSSINDFFEYSDMLVTTPVWQVLQVCDTNLCRNLKILVFWTSQILRVTIIGTHHLQHRFMVVCFCIRTDNIKCHNFPSGCNPYHLIFLN